MDKNTWENFPVGTYVRVTWDDDDREEYAVVRGRGESGGASAGNVGVYIGRHWDEIFDWAGASFEVLYAPKDEGTVLVPEDEYAYPDEQDDVIRAGDLVHLAYDYSDILGGSLGHVEEARENGCYVEFRGHGDALWVNYRALKKAVEG